MLKKAREAEAITTEARKRVDQIRNRVARLTPRRVFIQIGIQPLHTVNKDLFINEFIRLSTGYSPASASPGRWLWSARPWTLCLGGFALKSGVGRGDLLADKKRWMVPVFFSISRFSSFTCLSAFPRCHGRFKFDALPSAIPLLAPGYRWGRAVVPWSR